MIPVLRMFEVVIATAFYSGICYMIFEGTGELLIAQLPLCKHPSPACAILHA